MILALIFFLIYSSPVWCDSERESPSEFMNGYQLSDFEGFEDWRLVTVRYREDSKEIRFTYGNSLAWEALSEKSSDYPDGAIFAKLSVARGQDPAFPSSVLPGHHRRYQFMVRNKKMYQKTDGWGYALFNSKGEVLQEDPKMQTQACAACHSLVASRGHVFSTPFLPEVKHRSKQVNSSKLWVYDEKNISSLDALLKNYLQTQSKKINLLRNPFGKATFSGLLDEIRPILARKTLATNNPSVFLSQDKKSFSLVQMSADQKCKGSTQKALQGIHKSSENSKVFKVEFCMEPL